MGSRAGENHTPLTGLGDQLTLPLAASRLSRHMTHMGALAVLRVHGVPALPAPCRPLALARVGMVRPSQLWLRPPVLACTAW